jgi:hypothetical protein
MNAVVVVCLGLFLLGATAALRWGHLPIDPPWTGRGEGDDDDEVAVVERVRRALWFLDVFVIAAVAAGLLVLGPGGRLVMRLLAVTAGDAAQGKVTEAEEIVGRTTVGGSIGFVLFVGLFGAFFLGALYGICRKWLPPARRGAAIVALLAGVLIATRIDPLRPDNPDFDLVGPGWLAVVTFVGLGVLTILTFAAVAGRVAQGLPLVNRRIGAIAAHAPLVLMIPAISLFAFVVLAAIVGVGLLCVPTFRRLWASDRVLLGGRLVIGGVMLAFLPGFVGDLAAIL